MTVAELRAKLSRYDDDAEVLYFDSEAGQDVPLNINWLTIETKLETASD